MSLDVQARPCKVTRSYKDPLGSCLQVVLLPGSSDDHWRAELVSKHFPGLIVKVSPHLDFYLNEHTFSTRCYQIGVAEFCDCFPFLNTVLDQLWVGGVETHSVIPVAPPPLSWTVSSGLFSARRKKKRSKFQRAGGVKKTRAVAYLHPEHMELHQLVNTPRNVPADIPGW